MVLVCSDRVWQLVSVGAAGVIVRGCHVMAVCEAGTSRQCAEIALGGSVRGWH